ncbi:NYN domain-containing protein [Aporhodopirellula aestuarii]|uniref:NYN domain-containing protein n=1 Tax=Aporhodopirellula aestuarii TaxID=2950107 RepID=A0ABT0UBN8_9BACT|nr:NYN domain-containing protein [Aporhodopirellula aestuarii]MCM2374434.1 NYN domain-containing protein [Aporhodopirellula aestuarii]
MIAPVIPAPSTDSSDVSPNDAVILIDWENISSAGLAGIRQVLRDTGTDRRIVLIRAYADWSVHRAAGLAMANLGAQLVHVTSNIQGKNSADMQLTVDAMSLMHGHCKINTFAIVSGDRDFTPLVRELRLQGHEVLGFGRDDATSQVLRKLCDQFTFLKSPSANATKNVVARSSSEIGTGPNRRNALSGSTTFPASSRVVSVTDELRDAVALAFVDAWQVDGYPVPCEPLGKVSTEPDAISINRFFASLQNCGTDIRIDELVSPGKRSFARCAEFLAVAGLLTIDYAQPCSPKVIATGATISRLQCVLSDSACAADELMANDSDLFQGSSDDTRLTPASPRFSCGPKRTCTDGAKSRFDLVQHNPHLAG